MSSRIKFTVLTLRNFLSYGNNVTVFNLNLGGTILINGEDLDNTAEGRGANGVGKASSCHSLVKTPNGWIQMGDIKVGQLLRMPDGSVAPVTGVYPQGRMPLFKVTFADGRSTEVTEDHLWTVFSHRWGQTGTRGTKTITTRELNHFLCESNERGNKPWYNLFVPTITHPSLPDKELPIHPYVLGALLGDGCLSTPQLRFSTNDVEMVEHLDCLTDNTVTFSKDTNPADWRIGGSCLKEHVRSLGLLGCKSNTKFVPHSYLEETSQQQKLDLLAGLLDTDGTVGKTKNVSFCSVSEQLAKNVQYLVRSLGGKATITTRHPHYLNKEGVHVQGQTAYNVSIRYHSPTNLFRLTRKVNKLSEGETQYAKEGLRIVSVEQVEEGEAQCIMVDHPDHLYITDDFIVTHNTVVVNALSYALYDKAISDISKDNLVNNQNKKNMEVTIKFEKDGDEYFIRRVRKSRAGAAGNFVEFKKNGNDITRGEHSRVTNEAIVNVLGVPWELFSRIVVFSATSTPFLDMPVRHPTIPNQTAFIEELFDLKTLSEKAKVLKEHIKETELRLDTLKQKVELLKKEHERHHTQVTSAEQRVVNWEMTRRNEIGDMQRKLEIIEKVDVDAQRQYHDERNELDEAISESLAHQRSLEREIKKQQKSKTEAEKALKHLRDDKCPYCLQKYADAKSKIDENTETLQSATNSITVAETELETCEAKLAELSRRRTDVEEKITVSNIEELVEVKGKRHSITSRIKEREQEENPHTEALDELEAVELEEIDYSEVNELTKVLEHQQFLYKLLTKKDSFVRKSLLNKNIPYLNTRLRYYLSELGLPHTVEFTHEMTAAISQFGQLLDFGNLSNGQRARVNFALSLAFRDVLQSMHGSFNVCIFDEVLDVGLDSVGVQAAAKLLKRKGRDEDVALFIISHRDEIENAFDKSMTIQMSKGFSYIKDE